jgi:hypothetical protein
MTTPDPGCVFCGSEDPAWHGPGCPAAVARELSAVLEGQTKIELPENAQVAPSAETQPPDSPQPEENPVHDTDAADLTDLLHPGAVPILGVSLSVTVTQDALETVMNRLTATLRDTIADLRADGHGLHSASLSVYLGDPAADEDDDE